MTKELYYTAPNDEIFNEIKEKSIEVWQSYDDTYGYASEKTNRIKDIKNIKDNAMYIVAMFDCNNQKRLIDLLSDEAVNEIMARLEENIDYD